MANDQLLYVGQKAIIDHNGQVLVLTDAILGDDLPGGKVQEGETDFSAALQREVQEETGLEITVGRPFTTGHFHYPEGGGHRNAGKTIYLVVFACSYVSGEVHLSSEHIAYQWVDKHIYKSKVRKAFERDVLTQYFSL